MNKNSSRERHDLTTVDCCGETENKKILQGSREKQHRYQCESKQTLGRCFQQGEYIGETIGQVVDLNLFMFSRLDAFLK